MPVPAPVKQPEPIPFAMPSSLEVRIEQQPDVALPSPVFETVAPALLPIAAPNSSAAEASDPQRAVVEALAAAKQNSAADHMADAVWTIANGEATVQTDLSSKMLPVVMNPEAEKIARAALRDTGIARLTLLPGTPAAAGAKKTRPARTGSIQAKALEHPMVQQAQKLFHAEIQTVIDLRDAD
jgi:DNA polymerase-3 subunit gamma/tau